MLVSSLPASGAVAAVRHAGGVAGSPAPVAQRLGKPRPVHASGSGRTARHWSVNLRGLARRWRTAAKASIPAASRQVITPHDVQVTNATITANFAGNALADGAQLAGDPSAATNGTQILESTGVFLRVYNNNGSIACNGVILQHFLRTTTDVVGEARVQYDNANHRFSLMAGVFQQASTGGPTVLYVSASQTSDPCGTWNTYRLTLTGDAFPAGTFIDYPTLGQDSRALLIGTSEGESTDSGPNDFSVFAIPKAAVYADNAVSFPIFTPGSNTNATAVSNAGNPVIDSPSSYFIATGPGSEFGGYAVYRMDGSGSANPTLTQQAVITKPYFGPDPAPQPGTSNTLDALDGRLQASPVFDGRRIWFAQVIDATATNSGGPTTTVRYGFIDTTNNTIQVAQARHSATSADLNPSIGVGISPNGIETIFLNWVYTDAAHGIPASGTVASLIYDGGTLPDLQGVDQTLVTGSISATNHRFGEYSSVAIDPAVTNGTCAVTAQTYMTPPDGAWGTQVARLCGPAMAHVPWVINDTVSAARTALQAVGLRGDTLTTTAACDPSSDHLVAGSSPPPGILAPIGSDVTLAVCDLDVAVPDVVNRTDASATGVINAAGFTVGQVTSVPSCVVPDGSVVSQSPGGGNSALRGSAVSLAESNGRQANGKLCILK